MSVIADCDLCIREEAICVEVSSIGGHCNCFVSVVFGLHRRRVPPLLSDESRRLQTVLCRCLFDDLVNQLLGGAEIDRPSLVLSAVPLGEHQSDQCLSTSRR